MDEKINQIIDGKRKGNAIEYYKNGKVMSKLNYQNGKAEGKTKGVLL